jgi:hypothetical protein
VKLASPVLVLGSEQPEALYDCGLVSFQSNFVSVADNKAFDAEKKNYEYLYSSNPIDPTMSQFLETKFGISSIVPIEDNWFKFRFSSS